MIVDPICPRYQDDPDVLDKNPRSIHHHFESDYFDDIFIGLKTKIYPGSVDLKLAI